MRPIAWWKIRPLAWWNRTLGYHQRSDVDEFRAAALRATLYLIPVAVLGITRAFVVDYQGTPSALALLIPALTVLTLAAYRLVDRWVTLAAALTVVGLFVMLTVAIWLEPFGDLAPFFGLIVLVASATLGARPGRVTAGLAIVVIAVARLAPLPLMTDDAALAAAFLVVASAALCWTMVNPVSVALTWAWRSYDDAWKTTQALRDQRAELGRVVKSLNEAYTHLERLNDELARARRAAEEARRHKAEFATNISHELRTPLNLIIGFSEMVTSAPEAYGGQVLPDAYRYDLDTILRNAHHLSNLIDDVLDLGQIEASRMALVKEKMELPAVIGEAADVVARLFSAKGLDLIVHVATDLPRVYGDRTRIRQVLINLLGNAARFTDHGAVTITAEPSGNDVVVDVADTGVGMASDDIPRVFERFRQLDDPSHGRVGGSGLGLAVSKQIIELHGGSMWAESRVGEGTVFHFTLPVSSNVIAVAPPGEWQVWDRVMAGRPAEPPEVDVVSPDSSVAAIFRRYLEGYRVEWCPSLRQVLQKDHTQPNTRTACVVVGSSAQEAWQQALSSPRLAVGMPVFTCALQSRYAMARDLGVAAYLVKPISREQIASALKQLGVPLHTILIVDDDPDMLRLLGRWIRAERRGCRVWIAGGGDAAVAILRAKRPDAVLLDLLMPEVGGYAVLEEMRRDERLRDVPVVVITARGQQEEEVTAGLLGITRPGGLSVGQLMDCLRASLDALVGEKAQGARGPAGTPIGQSA